MRGVRLIALVVSLAIGAICQTSAVESPKQKSKLYDVTEWNNGVGDINGEVGHRLYVEGPRATCVNQNGEFLSSDAHRGIVSGILPPGLSFEPNDNAIAGIPTDRGHWIVRLILYPIECNGTVYVNSSFIQELRFHITGSGEVVE